MKFASHYSIMRFLPYPETGEFVNIGVTMLTPRVGFFDYELARRWRRVTDFFRELDTNVYRSALKYFEHELRVFSDALGTSRGQQLPFPINEEQAIAFFQHLTKPRESVFRFGEIRTVLTQEPEKKLHELFDYYVDRQFARDKEYQETMMANRLRTIFVTAELSRYYRADSVGNDRYEVPLPFVYRVGIEAIKAIKPLDLDKPTSTKIYEHGDQWINRVRRLRDMNELPAEMLFATRQPSEAGKRRSAGAEIIKELKNLETTVVPFSDQAAVLDFARVSD